MADFRMRHGIFMAPYHALDENPTVCLRRDLELVQFLDQLGFDEAWFGEHHSSGFETISSPELKQGDFGAYLFQAADWADWEQTKKSYELYARYVIPHFAKTNVNRQASYDWLTTELPKFNERWQQGVDAAFAKYAAHQERQTL